MMQPCASTAELRGGGPILSRGRYLDYGEDRVILFESGEGPARVKRLRLGALLLMVLTAPKVAHPFAAHLIGSEPLEKLDHLAVTGWREDVEAIGGGRRRRRTAGAICRAQEEGADRAVLSGSL